MQINAPANGKKVMYVSIPNDNLFTLMNGYKRLLAHIIRFCLCLRYSINIQGLEKLKNVKSTFILPNHPAEIDPVILMFYFLKVTTVRPVVLEQYHYAFGAKFFMNWFKAIPMPDLSDSQSPYKQKRAIHALNEVTTGLNNGDNILLYPAGRLRFGDFEQLGGKSGAYSILKNNPQTKVFLVRSLGLYGSSFSKAISGSSPNFTLVLLTSIWILLKNFIFFTPRRKVTITIQEAPDDFPRSCNIVTLNRWLENWYNKTGADSLTLVSRSFWHSDLPKINSDNQENSEPIDIPDEIGNKVITFITHLITTKETTTHKINISLESRLGDDLGIDSINMTDIAQWLDEEFDIKEIEFSQLLTVRDVAKMAIASHNNQKGHSATPTNINQLKYWQASAQKAPTPILAIGQTIPEVFINCASKMKRFAAIGDISLTTHKANIISWHKMKLGVLALSATIEKFPCQNIGILLPASPTTTITILATLLAKKTPVILNWTSGKENVRYATEVANISHIITSLAFLDRIETDLTSIEDKFVFLENIKQQMTLSQKIIAIIKNLLPAKYLIKLLSLDMLSKDSPAVILFTSGSETAPKGVPLSHSNILANIKGGLEVVDLKSTDVFCSILPPFHSFGFTITTILPIVTGLRVTYSPNPNESKKVVQNINYWGATHLAGTPSFISAIAKAANSKNLESLRLIIVGAEKAPRSLFEAVSKIAPNATLLEGYGITECSPIVTANTMNEPPSGVGKPISGINLLIIHPDTHAILSDEQVGLILISGDSVFNGYIDKKLNPFITINSIRWYNSGDLGYIKNNRLYIAGRLKRFVKIAGEMISLPALEDALKTNLSDTTENDIAIIGIEPTDGTRTKLYLATTKDIELNNANETLAKAGFPRFAKLSNVIKLDSLPTLGSGKIDIKSIEQQITQHIGKN